MIAAEIDGNAKVETMDQITPTIASEAAPFDYSAMDQATADEAQAVATRYRQRSKSYFMDTGRDLLSMKDRLDHGLFLRWVEAEMGLTARTAQNFMQAAAQLGHKSETVAHLPAGVLYKLAASSTPAPVRDEIVGRLEAGEPLTARDIDFRLLEARVAARDAKLSPDERKRQAQTKRAVETRRKREHEKWQQKSEERRQRKDAATQELAQLLASRLDDHAFKVVVGLLRECDSWHLPDALIKAYGPLAGEGEGDARTV